MSSTEHPFVTIVIPVFNEEAYINDTLHQLVSQEYPSDRVEILVVDGMSDDRTRELVSQWSINNPQIVLLDNPRRKSSSGRNVGFKAGKGDYFVVIDGHCFIPDTHLIENIVSCFEKSGADCLGRPQTLDPPGLSDFQKAVAIARASRIGHGGDSHIYSDFSGFISPVSNGAAYRKDVFEKVGFVDETFDACEDVEFNYRVEKAGLSCYTAPSLLVKYYPRDSLQGLFQQLARYGQGRRRFVHKHLDALTVNQLVPCFFVLGLLLLIPSIIYILLSGKLVALPMVCVVPYLFYTCLIGWVTINLCFQKGWKYLFILPVIVFVVHFSLGFGFMKRIM